MQTLHLALISVWGVVCVRLCCEVQSHCESGFSQTLSAQQTKNGHVAKTSTEVEPTTEDRTHNRSKDPKRSQAGRIYKLLYMLARSRCPTVDKSSEKLCIRILELRSVLLV